MHDFVVLAHLELLGRGIYHNVVCVALHLRVAQSMVVNNVKSSH